MGKPDSIFLQWFKTDRPKIWNLSKSTHLVIYLNDSVRHFEVLQHGAWLHGTRIVYDTYPIRIWYVGYVVKTSFIFSSLHLQVGWMGPEIWSKTITEPPKPVCFSWWRKSLRLRKMTYAGSDAWIVQCATWCTWRIIRKCCTFRTFCKIHIFTRRTCCILREKDAFIGSKRRESYSILTKRCQMCKLTQRMRTRTSVIFLDHLNISP